MFCTIDNINFICWNMFSFSLATDRNAKLIKFSFLLIGRWWHLCHEKGYHSEQWTVGTGERENSCFLTIQSPESASSSGSCHYFCKGLQHYLLLVKYPTWPCSCWVESHVKYKCINKLILHYYFIKLALITPLTLHHLIYYFIFALNSHSLHT